MKVKDINPKLLKKHDTLIWKNLNIINYNNIKNFSIFISVILFLLIFIDYFNKSRGLWDINHGYILLFYSHIIFILTLLLFLLIYYFKHDHTPSFYKYYVLIFSAFILDIGAYISGWVDQMIHGEITIYLIGCFIISILLYLKPKHLILLYIQSYMVFIVLLNITQKNDAIRQGDFINSFIIILVACFISNTISGLKQKEYIYKYKLEELVKVRSDALIIQQKAINHLQQFNLIGEMSASIAHEIRNPMTAVRGFLQLLGAKDYNTKDKPFFELMIEELDRANAIIAEFLSLTKDKELKLENKNLNNIISKLIPLIDTNINYSLVSDLGEIPELLLNEREICQVILNLANNGYDAMPLGGCLTIKTYQLNDEVILEVQDEGEGINPETLKKMGTPFFTTKEKGTGLGLAVCKSIITQHNAQLDIQSSPEGSNFRVIFNIAS